MSIISSLPYVFVNGTTIDATQVNTNLAQVAAQTNALAATGGAALLGAAAATNNAGATIQAQLTNVGSITGAANVGMTPVGTGAVATTVAGKLQQIISVVDRGADPTGVPEPTVGIVHADEQ